MKNFTTYHTNRKNRRILRMIPMLAAAGLLSTALTGCDSSNEEVQRYSWPLATASPEDTVTQIFAEKFAEEVSDLSNGKMKIQVMQTLPSAVTAIYLKPVLTETFLLLYRTQLLRFPS